MRVDKLIRFVIIVLLFAIIDVARLVDWKTYPRWGRLVRYIIVAFISGLIMWAVIYCSP